jgi:hypothetical protein
VWPLVKGANTVALSKRCLHGGICDGNCGGVLLDLELGDSRRDVRFVH